MTNGTDTASTDLSVVIATVIEGNTVVDAIGKLSVNA